MTNGNLKLISLASALVMGSCRVWALAPDGLARPLDPQRSYLRPVEQVSGMEQQAVERFQDRFERRVEQDDFSAAEEFLAHFPRGAWSPALRLRLAEEFYGTGWYSKAIGTLEQLWAERGANGTPAAAVLSSRAGVQLAELYARLGRREDAEGIIQILRKGTVALEDLETLRGVEQGLATMQRRPEATFRCGALALERIRVFLASTNAGHPVLLYSRSTPKGMNLAEVAALAEATGMKYQMAYRSPGAVMLKPAVMHLRIGHFVSVLREVRGKLQIEDPTGWQSTFASKAAIESEASGYFLVPAGRLPKGWRRVDATEGALVFGRNGVLENDPDATTDRDRKAKCGSSGGSSYGLAAWDVHLMLVSQEVVDTPIRYEPPFGLPIEVTFRHAQRANQRFGFKPTWTHNWTAQIYENPRELLGDLWLQAGGGWERLSALDEEASSYQSRTFNTGRITRPDSSTLVWTLPDGSQKTYRTLSSTNVAWGRVFYLSALTDPAGNRVTIQMQPNGRVESVSDPLGRMTRFYYELTDPGIPSGHGSTVLPNLDYTNQVTRIVDPFGRTAQLQYAKTERWITGFCIDPSGTTECPFFYYNYDLTNITDVAGLSSRFAYDSTGTLITQLTTPYGTTQFKWSGEGSGFRMDVTDPEGETERFEFSWFGQSTEQALWSRPQGMRTDGVGYEVRHWGKKAFAESLRSDSVEGATVYVFQSSDTWSSAGRVLMGVKKPLENTVWYNYPGQGAASLPGVGLQPTRVGRVLDDASTQLWQTDRDAWGNIVRRVDPVGRTTRYVYDANFIDPLEGWQVVDGRQELLFRTTWNAQHLPLSVLDASGQTTRYTYNSRGQITSVTNARNELTTFSYDAEGFLTSIDGPLPGNQDRKSFTYDLKGRVRTVSDSDGYTITIDYEPLDRITKVTFPDGTSETRLYDRMGLGTVRDRIGRESKFLYDGLGRLISAQDALGRTSRFQWCGCGDLSALIDPLGRMTQWHRDLQGRLVSKEYADGSMLRYEYERTTSRLHKRRDELGQVAEFSYSLANEPLAQRYLNPLRPTPDVFFAYDRNYPRMASMTDGNGTTVFGYHPANGQPGAGQLATVDGPWANDEATYDYDELGRVSQRAIHGVGVRWSFDESGRLTEMTNVLGTFTHVWEAASKRLASVNYPDGQRSDYAYFDTAGDHLLQRITHSLAGGAKLSEFTYAYDPVGRITQWTQLQGSRTKTLVPAYDPVDRLTNVVETIPPSPAKPTAWTYDAADNLTSESANGSRRDFAYNALNQLGDFKPATGVSEASYEWDAENRLVAISNATQRVEFEYDGLGRRTRIVERNGGTIVSDRRYLWCGLQLCEERDASGATVLKRYSYYGVQNLAAAELAPGQYFYSRDHLGSIREMTSGAVTAFDYSAYGDQQTLSGALTSDFGFTGHFLSRSTGTTLAPFRGYSPKLGRWLNRDPQGERGGLNLYAYVEGDPMNLTDPLGLYGMDDLSRDWQSVKDWASEHKESIKKVAKKAFEKTKVGKEVKKFEDFDDSSEKILNTELEVKEALDDPDCGHSGARLLRQILSWFPSSVQLGPINNADLFGKTLDEGEKNVDAYFNRMNQIDQASQRDARN